MDKITESIVINYYESCSLNENIMYTCLKVIEQKSRSYEIYKWVTFVCTLCCLCFIFYDIRKKNTDNKNINAIYCYIFQSCGDIIIIKLKYISCIEVDGILDNFFKILFTLATLKVLFELYMTNIFNLSGLTSKNNYYNFVIEYYVVLFFLIIPFTIDITYTYILITLWLINVILFSFSLYEVIYLKRKYENVYFYIFILCISIQNLLTLYEFSDYFGILMLIGYYLKKYIK